MIETILNSPGKKKSGLKSIYTTRKWRSLLLLTQRGNSSIHYITQVTDNETDPPVMKKTALTYDSEFSKRSKNQNRSLIEQ